MMCGLSFYSKYDVMIVWSISLFAFASLQRISFDRPSLIKVTQRHCPRKISVKWD
jgi:hypothetical protein